MYYPKSQIKPNLYTSGNKYILSTTQEGYIGYYYELSNGKTYTGKNPQDGSNIELLISFPNSFLLERTNENFDSPSSSPLIDFISEDGYSTFENSSRYVPTFNPTTPTSQDQQNGQFTRYFCKKNNELQYLEINQDTFKKLQRKDPQIAWDLFTPSPIIWQISGNKEQVYASNRASAIAIEQNLKWYGFSQYFQDKFLKYYVES